MFVQKDSILRQSATAFAFDSTKQLLGDVSLDGSTNCNEITLQQVYLSKLKTQRENMEEITRLYEESLNELKKRAERERKLEREIEKLTELCQNQEDYTKLKKEFDLLHRRYQLCEYQIVDLKKEMQNVLEARQEEVVQLKQELKFHKEQKSLADIQWQNLLSDRDELLKRQVRTQKQKQTELNQKISVLEEENQALKERVKQKQLMHGKSEQLLQRAIQMKERNQMGVERQLEGAKREIAQLKSRLAYIEKEKQQQKIENVKKMEEANKELQAFRRQRMKKDNQIFNLVESVNLKDQLIQKQEISIANLKFSLKKSKFQADCTVKNISLNGQEQKSKLELHVQALRLSIQQLQSQRANLTNQVRRTKSQLDRKEKEFKHKKLSVWSEFKQVEKEMKQIRRIV